VSAAQAHEYDLPPAVIADALQRVPNAPLRERFLAIEARGVKRSALALLVAHACGWTRDGDDPRAHNSKARHVHGALIALGIESDRWGARRTLIRRYRVAQVEEALARVEAALDAGPKMPGPREAA
jgi:hypothetical protein